LLLNQYRALVLVHRFDDPRNATYSRNPLGLKTRAIVRALLKTR